MDQADQFLSLSGHKALDKIHIVPVMFCGHPECGIVVTVVHNILGTQSVAIFLLKLFQGLHGHSGPVSKPIHELFLCITAKHQGEMIKKRGKAHHVRVRIVL